MTISSLSSYKAAIEYPGDLVVQGYNPSSISNRFIDLWSRSILNPSIPGTTPVTLDSTSTGGFLQRNATTGQLSLLGTSCVSSTPTAFIICDRLVHRGGFSGNGNSIQSMGTISLSRYTSGEGVYIGITIYTAVGSTATTLNVSYTNSQGTSGRTGTVVFGGTGFNEANRMLLVPLASGDTGVLSVQSVRAQASTGTTGNFGVTLFKPLFMSFGITTGVGAENQDFISGNAVGGIPAVLNDACLFPIQIAGPQSGTNNMTIRLLLNEN